MRGIYNTLPFQSIPNPLIIEINKAAVFWLNSFPPKDGISNDLSPNKLITGAKIDYKRHCRHEFGDYVQTYEPHDNSMQLYTVGVLVIQPTGNCQGSYYYWNLNTKRVISRTHATPLPMPEEVIAAIEGLNRGGGTGLNLGLEDHDQTN